MWLPSLLQLLTDANDAFFQIFLKFLSTFHLLRLPMYLGHKFREVFGVKLENDTSPNAPRLA